ncbi:MAG: hypothetical protein GX610_02575 [Rhodococcus sp.]|nr:hypothetical protein [Rhodococcus sp. (in: high G+C Gram-positive bacteria)]
MPTPEPPAPNTAPGPVSAPPAEPVAEPDYKAPAAAAEPSASRDAPTPTWLAANPESETVVSSRKPRKTRTPKVPKPTKAPTPSRAPETSANSAGTPTASATPPPPPPVAEPTPQPPQPPQVPHPQQPPKQKSKRPILIGAFGAVAALLVGIVVIAIASKPGGLGNDDTANAAAPTTTAAADNFCVESTDGNTITSNGPGDQSSGPNVILAFEHAYYVARDGEQAYALSAPDALAVDAQDIQDGIDQAPVDTDYCATITERAPGQFKLDLAVRMSASKVENYEMYIDTTEIDGKSFITRMGSKP